MAKSLVCDVVGLPNYFSKLLIYRSTNDVEATSMKKQQFLDFWKNI